MSYLHHRVARIPGSSYAIAAGFASGAAVSFTPFIGFHFIMACLLAWVLRANILTSAMGTVVGNPWTFPFIWIAIYHTGVWLLGWEATDNLVAQVRAMLGSLTFSQAVTDPVATLGPFLHRIMLPMFIGGLLMGAVVWFVCYWPLYTAVKKYKNNRFLKRLKAKERNERKKTP